MRGDSFLSSFFLCGCKTYYYQKYIFFWNLQEKKEKIYISAFFYKKIWNCHLLCLPLSVEKLNQLNIK